MSYDYQKLYAAIIQSVATNGSFTERMHLVIQECEAQVPHPDWAKYRAIDFQADSQSLPQWLEKAFGFGWPNQSSQGLWVGLVQTERGGKVAADAYASASPSFSPLSIEWAYKVERNGASSYLRSEVLVAIYRLAYESGQGLGNDAEYPLVLAYGAMATRAALEAPSLPASLANLRGAAVGYDDGDLLFLGEFADGKFVANVRPG